MMLKRILYPTDFSPLSNAALPYAVLLASVFGSRLVLLHVMMHDLPYLFQMESRYLNDLSELLDKTMKRASHWLPAEPEVVRFLVERGLSPTQKIPYQASHPAG